MLWCLSGRSIVRGAILLPFLGCWSANAAAEGALVITIHQVGTRPQSLPTTALPAVITIGRTADVLGRQVRFTRSVFAGIYAPQRVSSSPTAPMMPVAGAMTSGFGMREHPLLGYRRMHSGVDLAAPIGTPISATFAGVVASAAWNGGYGLMVDVHSGDDTETKFGHMSRLNVSVGQHVSVGDILGFVGSTGLSTGPHVHYEIRKNNRAINPFATTRVMLTQLNGH